MILRFWPSKNKHPVLRIGQIWVTPSEKWSNLGAPLIAYYAFLNYFEFVKFRGISR